MPKSRTIEWARLNTPEQAWTSRDQRFTISRVTPEAHDPRKFMLTDEDLPSGHPEQVALRMTLDLAKDEAERRVSNEPPSRTFTDAEAAALGYSLERKDDHEFALMKRGKVIREWFLASSAPLPPFSDPAIQRAVRNNESA